MIAREAVSIVQAPNPRNRSKQESPAHLEIPSISRDVAIPRVLAAIAVLNTA